MLEYLREGENVNITDLTRYTRFKKTLSKLRIDREKRSQPKELEKSIVRIPPLHIETYYSTIMAG